MYTVESLPLAILFCVVTMLGWGSWANTQKLAGKDRWPFELYYWDYALGVALFGALFATLLGGDVWTRVLGGQAPWGRALASGALFNLSNILLVVAIDAAGIAVAFPVGVGLALVIGTVMSYVQSPKGNAAMLFAGVGLIVLAMLLSAAAHGRLSSSGRSRGAGAGSRRGVVFAVIAGCLMGSFYPQLSTAMGEGLGPYGALVVFGAGLLASNLVINTVFLRVGGHSYGQYFAGGARLHSLGLLGGAIWMLALSLNVLASGVAGPAVSYALGQGATLVAAIWGVFVWREFAGAPAGTMPLVWGMFAAYVSGLTLIGLATL